MRHSALVVSVRIGEPEFKGDSSCNDPTEDKTYTGTSLGACASEPVKPEEWMAVFHIYADASGKLSNSAYTSFCGYVAHVSEWRASHPSGRIADLSGKFRLSTCPQ